MNKKFTNEKQKQKRKSFLQAIFHYLYKLYKIITILNVKKVKKNI